MCVCVCVCVRARACVCSSGHITLEERRNLVKMRSLPGWPLFLSIKFPSPFHDFNFFLSKT